MSSHPYNYIALFVSRHELDARLRGLGYERLAKPIEHTHMTLAYRPDEVDTALFGEQAELEALGYGRDENNEGLLVRLASASERVRALADGVKTPHITLSVSGDGRPVDTARLDFGPITPFTLHAVFAGWHRDGFVDDTGDRA